MPEHATPDYLNRENRRLGARVAKIERSLLEIRQLSKYHPDAREALRKIDEIARVLLESST